jgi:hypothetical protein
LALLVLLLPWETLETLTSLAEDLECVKMWLDDKKAPKTDSDGSEYSVIGRMQRLYNNRDMEKTREDYLRGYMRALRDLEHIVDNSEHLDDGCLLEVLYEAIVDREVIRD